MNEIVSQDIETPIIILFMIMSLVIAFFYIKIFETLFDLHLKKWLFFGVIPSLIGIVTLIDKRFSFSAFLLLFLSVFPLAFIGMMYSAVKTIKRGIAEKDTLNKKHNLQPITWWQKMLMTVGGLLLLVVFTFFGFYVVPLIFLIIPYMRWVFPSNESRFFKLQNSLPTSKIRSLAMGLAEIEGNLEMIQPILSPIGKKKCIGYQHNISNINYDDNGKEKLITIFTEVVCNPFYIVDDTGKIEVNPEKLEFVLVNEDNQYRRDGEMHTEYLLHPNDKMLLIGKASIKEKNQPVFEYEAIKKVFAISPSVSIANYNTYKPLLNSFIGFSCVFAFVASIILITPIKISNDKIIIEKPNFGNTFFTTNKADTDNVPADSTKQIDRH